jgi:PAS domain S-box-containing protein
MASKKKNSEKTTKRGASTEAEPLIARPVRRQTFPIVGIGASAGGLEAFRQLLEHLPPDTGMAFVLVPHLDPKHESILAELLSRGTRMPVSEVTDGMRVEPNHVYVIPRNINMAIKQGILRLSPHEETRGQRRPIDYFLRSLAEERSSRAIGVILSGTASDGTLGLEAIKAEGGITFAQDEKRTKYDDMPRSAISAGCVDFELPPDRIAEELARMARRPHVGAVEAARREKRLHPYVEPTADSAALREGDRIILQIEPITLIPEPEPAEVGKAQMGSGAKRLPAAKDTGTQLRQELESTRECLQSVIKQQEAYAEKLQSADEEIQSSNEEPQNIIEELETAKEELRSSNQEKLFLQTGMIESSFEPIFAWDFDNGVVEWNQGCERLYGFMRAEAVGRVTHDLLRTIYPMPIEEVMARLAAQGEWMGELRHTTKDGREVIVESRQQLSETDGRRLVLETNRDITEHRRADDRLHESEARFRTLADCAPAPIWVNGPDAGCEFVNKAYLDFFGKTLAEVQGFGWQPHAHPDDAERYTGSYLSAFNARAPFRCQARFLNAQGEYRWLDSIGLPRFSASGEFLGYAGASPDITETKRAELNTQFINRLDLAMSQLSDADEIIRLTTGKLGEYLGVARCRVSEINPAAGLAVVRENWEGWLHGSPSMAGEYRIADFGAPKLKKALETGEALVVNNVTTDPRTLDFASKYESLGVGALITVPSLNEKQWETTLTVDQPQARDWRPDEIQLMRDICVRLSLAVRQARAAKDLRESEERFRALTNATSDVLYRMSPDWTEMRHLRGREFIADTLEPSRAWLEKYIHPNDQKRVMEAINRALQTKSVFELEHPVIRVDGTLGWIYSRAVPILDANGEIVEWFGAASDVTQRKLTQQALLESEERARRTLAEQMVAGVYECDAAGKFMLVNQRYCDIVGYTEAELMKMRVEDVTYVEDWPHNAELYRRLYENGESFFIEKRHLRKDGSEVWVNSHVSPIRNAEGKIEESVAVVVDVTERKRAERELAAAKDRLAADLDAMTRLQKIGAVFVQKGDLRAAVEEIVEAAIAISGADKGNIRIFDTTSGKLVIQAQRGFERPFLDFWNTVEEGMGACGAALQRGERVIVEDVTQSPIFAGTPALDVQLQAGVRSVQSTPVLSSSGKLMAVFSTHYVTPGRPDERALRLLDLLARATADIIERAQAERALRSAYEQAEEAMRAKDEFLAVVSHELRSPLNSILGYARLLRAETADVAQIKQLMGIIERNGRMQLQLIEDLLDTARIITGKLELEVQPVDLVAVITAALDVVRPSAQAKGVRLISNLNPLAGQITGDPDRLQQVVWNLLSNAIKFTPENGRVEIILKRMDPHVAIIVRDTGRGIEREFMPHIFERFRQADMSSMRRAGGLGLGLSLANHLVELHGGTIEAESAGAGQGATFTVRLPVRAVYTVQPEERKTVTVVPPAGAKSLAGVRALIVDDEEEARLLLTLMLQNYGAETVAVSSGKDALELLARQTPDERFDMLICDIGMPKEDGYTVMRKVREAPPDKGGAIPAVALTAYGRAEDRLRALRAGFQMHVTKPVDPDELSVVILSLLKRGDVM